MFVVIVISQGSRSKEGQTRRRNWFGLPVEPMREKRKDNEFDELGFMVSIKRRLGIVSHSQLEKLDGA